MKRGLPIHISLCCIVFAFVPSSRAQWRPSGDRSLPSCSDVVGSVYQAPGAAWGAHVDLRGFSDALPQSSVIANGMFEFRCVPHGAYDLRVLDSRGKVIHSEQVEVGAGFNSVHITLRQEQTEQPVSPWVSLRQLKRKTDRKAEDQLRKAYAAADRSKFDEAALHARKALERDPAYPEAFVMLGAACSRLQRNEEAAEHFSKAVELDPDSVLAHGNLAMTMLKLERYAAAEEPARRALKLASPLPQMHFALGVSLAGQGRNLDEAILHFDRASKSFPRARLAAVTLLVHTGRRSDAATRLEEYLRAPGDIDNRKELETLLTNLK
jgi:Flp pilus assembly protein TadD